jgi:hypothetical protein
VFRGVYGVINTVRWMEGLILIPKRMMFWKGVKVFSRFGGERIKFIVRILDAIISGKGFGNELLNF